MIGAVDGDKADSVYPSRKLLLLVQMAKKAGVPNQFSRVVLGLLQNLMGVQDDMPQMQKGKRAIGSAK